MTVSGKNESDRQRLKLRGGGASGGVKEDVVQRDKVGDVGRCEHAAVCLASLFSDVNVTPPHTPAALNTVFGIFICAAVCAAAFGARMYFQRCQLFDRHSHSPDNSNNFNNSEECRRKETHGRGLRNAGHRCVKRRSETLKKKSTQRGKKINRRVVRTRTTVVRYFLLIDASSNSFPFLLLPFILQRAVYSSVIRWSFFRNTTCLVIIYRGTSHENVV